MINSRRILFRCPLVSLIFFRVQLYDPYKKERQSSENDGRKEHVHGLCRNGALKVVSRGRASYVDSISNVCTCSRCCRSVGRGKHLITRGPPVEACAMYTYIHTFTSAITRSCSRFRTGGLNLVTCSLFRRLRGTRRFVPSMRSWRAQVAVNRNYGVREGKKEFFFSTIVGNWSVEIRWFDVFCFFSSFRENEISFDGNLIFIQ